MKWVLKKFRSKYMRVLLISLVLIICYLNASSQLKLISPNQVYNKKVNQHDCIDSNQNITKFCAVDLLNFEVVFYRTYINKKTNELRLIGKVCFADTGDCFGFPGISIFKSSIKENHLTNFDIITETTNATGSDEVSNSGFFDITLKVNSEESLFFYNPSFFLKEYKISQLFQNSIVR